MKKIGFMKDALILFAITLAAGICLGGVYEITKGPIAIAEMGAKADAYKKVFKEAASFWQADYLEDEIKNSGSSMAGLGIGGVQVEDLVIALDGSGNQMGYVVTSTSKNGFNGNITVTVGISADGAILGIEYLTLEETPGLGMNASNPGFKDQFIGKRAEVIRAVDSKGAAGPDEIDAMSGATITSQAVASAVSAALYFTNNMTGQ